MSDRWCGTIEIGGNLPRKKLRPFLKQLRDSGGGNDWEGGFAGKTEKSLAELLDGGPTLTLRDNQASGGCFYELEIWCRENSLSFDAHHEACYDIDAGIERWRPGMQHSVTVSSDSGRSLLVDGDVVAKARQHLSEGNIYAALRKLDAVLVGVVIDKVPPFQIV